MEKSQAKKAMYQSDLNTQAQDWIIEQLNKLEVIQNIGKRATQGHDKDCPCAACLMTRKALEQ